jgi:hemerythrin-like domain-containing protein
MDAITLLRDDHRRIEKLFGSFECTGKRARKTRRRLVDQMAAGLIVHTTLEEHIFYPLVRQSVADADFVILEAIEEHHVVKLLLNELGKISPSDEEFAPKAAVLIQAVRQHVQREEREVFPRMRKSVGRARLGEIGDAMRKVQRKAGAASPKAMKKAAKKTLKHVA